jgi:hypothetical protein
VPKRPTVRVASGEEEEEEDRRCKSQTKKNPSFKKSSLRQKEILKERSAAILSFFRFHSFDFILSLSFFRFHSFAFILLIIRKESASFVFTL